MTTQYKKCKGTTLKGNPCRNWLADDNTTGVCGRCKGMPAGAGGSADAAVDVDAIDIEASVAQSVDEPTVEEAIAASEPPEEEAMSLHPVQQQIIEARTRMDDLLLDATSGRYGEDATDAFYNRFTACRNVLLDAEEALVAGDEAKAEDMLGNGFRCTYEAAEIEARRYH